MENLLAPDGWRFTGATDEAAHGHVSDDADGPALVIEHTEYAEGSRWEQIVTGLPSGTLLTLTGRVRSQGPCLRKIGKNAAGQEIYLSGTSLGLEAVSDTRKANPESVEAPFPFPPLNPEGTVQEEAALEGEVEMTPKAVRILS